MNTNTILSVVFGFALGFFVSWMYHTPAKAQAPVVETPAVEVVPAEKPPAELLSVPLPPQEVVEPAPAEAPKTVN